MTTNEDLRDAGILRAVLREQFAVSQYRDVLRYLNRTLFPDVLGRLRARLERIEVHGFDRGAATTARLTEMASEIATMVRDGMGSTYVKLRPALQAYARQEASWQVGALRTATPSIGVSFGMPSADVLRSIITAQPMRGPGVGSARLREWFRGVSDDLAGRIDRTIALGVSQGETIDQMVRRIRGTRAASYSDGVMQTTRTQAQTLVRSAVAHTSNAAREATFAANADAVKGEQWVATLDDRTCPICVPLDGKVWQTGERSESPPAHPNCRCTLVPVLKSWRELGIDADELEPSTRASMDGQVASTVTYREWLRGQSREVQDRVLGKGKAQLWRSGRISADDLTDSLNRPRRLSELEDIARH